jgi:hypothetical protein
MMASEHGSKARYRSELRTSGVYSFATGAGRYYTHHAAANHFKAVE